MVEALWQPDLDFVIDTETTLMLEDVELELQIVLAWNLETCLRVMGPSYEPSTLGIFCF